MTTETNAQTPRTDAEAQWAEWNGEAFQCVHATFARELEQELREAVKWRGVMTEIADKAQARAEAAESALEVAKGRLRGIDGYEGHSEAWFAVCKALDKAVPGWSLTKNRCGRDCATDAITALQSRLDAAERDAGRYRTKRSIDHERLKTTVAYERANDDERAMMEAAWFLSYDSAIDTRAAVLSASEDKGDKHD